MQALGEAKLDTFVNRQASPVGLEAASVLSAPICTYRRFLMIVCLFHLLCLKTKDSFEVRNGQEGVLGGHARGTESCREQWDHRLQECILPCPPRAAEAG